MQGVMGGKGTEGEYALASEVAVRDSSCASAGSRLPEAAHGLPEPQLAGSRAATGLENGLPVQHEVSICGRPASWRCWRPLLKRGCNILHRALGFDEAGSSLCS